MTKSNEISLEEYLAEKEFPGKAYDITPKGLVFSEGQLRDYDSDLNSLFRVMGKLTFAERLTFVNAVRRRLYSKETFPYCINPEHWVFFLSVEVLRDAFEKVKEAEG